MAQTVLIVLTVAGSDTGPFDLYSDADGYTTPFESGITKASLVSGYTSVLVPDLANIIRVMSVNELCENYIDLTILPNTTTTTSTSTSTTTSTSTSTTTSTSTSTTSTTTTTPEEFTISLAIGCLNQPDGPNSFAANVHYKIDGGSWDFLEEPNVPGGYDGTPSPYQILTATITVPNGSTLYIGVLSDDDLDNYQYGTSGSPSGSFIAFCGQDLGSGFVVTGDTTRYIRVNTEPDDENFRFVVC